MRARKHRNAQVGCAARGGGCGERRAGARGGTWTRCAVLLVLAPAAFLATSAQAVASSEAPASPAVASHDEEREERVALKRSRLESERAARRAQREEKYAARSKAAAERNEHGGVAFACTGVTWTFKAFPDLPGNTVSEQLTIARNLSTRTLSTFSFDGPTGTSTTPLELGPGRYHLSALARWSTNGIKGHLQTGGKLTCSPAPAFSIKMLQRIAGSAGGYTSSTLQGLSGETVDYEVVLRNTGNVALTLGPLSDPPCDQGTLWGGPGASPLAPGASSTYTCTHVLGPADKSAGLHANLATDTATPPPGEGAPVTQPSNPVVVDVSFPPMPAFSIELFQRIAGGSGSYTSATLRAPGGQTVDYEAVVKNTGNEPLTFAELGDPLCDPGTLLGGPGGVLLAPGAVSIYLCTHVLDSADVAAGKRSSIATESAAPPPGEGQPVARFSNAVLVEVEPAPAAPAGGGSAPPGASGSPTPTPSPAQASAAPASRVLGFAEAVPPSLHGPLGCVRAGFHASLRAAGVQSVTFYLDGHKLKTLTARNARKGLISIEINPGRLAAGPHRLTAKITMTSGASAAAAHGSRTLTFLRCR